jgi:cell division protein FtsI (penicillin-binding protein 3)
LQRSLYIVRGMCVIVAMATFYIALATHVYDLQVSRHEELYEKAKKKYTTSQTEKGMRGRIFDVDANLLAGNVACRDILAEPRRFTVERAEIIAALSESLGIAPHVLAKRFARAFRGEDSIVEMVVQRGVSIERADRVAAYRFKGLRFEDTYRRHYPKGTLLANVLGFLGPEGGGATGVEQMLDTDLQPVFGQAFFERDRKGNRISAEERLGTEATDGADVYLTIREPIQQIVEDELAELVEQFAPKAAYAVMAEPSTGAVLAMAQYPTFDSNSRENMDPANWRNRIVSDGFEPGSIMKAVAVAGAIDYGTITLDDVFDCEHGYWVYARRPLRDCHQYDDLTVWEIMQKSSNIGTAKIALELGKNNLYQTLTRFGFGQATGIGLGEEATGIFRHHKRWDSLSITRFPIGQGILVTPLQMVQAYCALANDGLMMQLYLIDRMVGPEPGNSQCFFPRAKRRCVRPHAARQVTQALKLVTEEGGTAPKAVVLGYKVAGKTGTAQKVERYQVNGRWRGRYVNRYVSNFIGYVPADDPAFVLLVVADETSRGGHYGGTVAAPTFSRIAEKTLRYLQVAPAGEPVSRLPGSPSSEAEHLGADSHQLR